MKTAKGAKRAKGKGRRRVGRKRRPRVPPADSKLWPQQYRGQNWKPAYGLLFAGKCQLCVYSCPLPKSRQLLDKWHGMTRLLLCTNHPASPGELTEVLPTETCRNFTAKKWLPPRAERAKKLTSPEVDESDPTVRRIPLSNGLFATVDAADYEKVSKYKWYASYRGSNVYAVCNQGKRRVYMHRMLMRPRTGYIVHHLDGNGLNNRRCNLRVCTRREHQASRGPCGGTSRFVGVFRHNDKKGKWHANIQWRGEHYDLGLFDDEIEAAKARDRKAYELHGERAYLNRPEDLRRWLRQRRRAGRRKGSAGARPTPRA